MRLRAFQATGCAILVNGKNDGLIEVRGIDGPIAVVKPGVPFRDPEYVRTPRQIGLGTLPGSME